MSGRISGIVLGIGLVFAAACTAGALPERKPAVAGAWYEASPEALKAQVGRLLASARGKCLLPAQDRPVALVVPHAGYVYSGATAAAAYDTLRGGTWKRVILLGPAHRVRLQGAALPEVSAFVTPLGSVPLDRAVCDALAAKPAFSVNTEAHAREHCLECQLPFLQTLLPGAKIVPILLGAAGAAEQAAVATALGPFLDENTLLVVSTDFTHYGESYGFAPFHENVPANLRKWNLEAAQAILALDRPRFEKHLGTTGDTICGAVPLLVALRALSDVAKRKSVKGVQADYTTSGEKTGDWSLSVSYLSLVFVDPPAGPSPAGPVAPPLLNAGEQGTLLKLARKTLQVYLAQGSVPADIAAGIVLTPALKKTLGAFVTLKKSGQLRGCIGYVIPVKPLYEAVADMAVNAAVHDPRFSPVTANELKDLKIEISVLSPLTLCPDWRTVKVGVHGLVLRQGGRSGLLLPQVPVEWGWDRDQFLEHLCDKAGLPPGSYRAPDAQLYTFTAEVFHEK